MPSRLSRLAGPLVIGLVGTGILVALGIWQVQRLAWKEALIARLEARLEAEPVPLPEAPDPARDRFLRVRLEGRLAAGAAYVLTTRRPHGPGYKAVAPLELADGRRVLVDLGYLPEAERGAALPEPGTRIEGTGALFWPEQASSTPAPDRERSIFFSRHVPPLAEALGTEPVLAVAGQHDLPAPWPEPRRLGVDLPNNHRNYAITWFSLAVVWAVMSGLWARRRLGRAG